MIAMLLVAQLGAQIALGPAVQIVPAAHNNPIAEIRTFRHDACPGAGRMEVSQAMPTALYRQGDRPPHLYLNRYPEPKLCLIGGAP